MVNGPARCPMPSGSGITGGMQGEEEVSPSRAYSTVAVVAVIAAAVLKSTPTTMVTKQR